jgi:hypothetical protein
VSQIYLAVLVAHGDIVLVSYRHSKPHFKAS